MLEVVFGLSFGIFFVACWSLVMCGRSSDANSEAVEDVRKQSEWQYRQLEEKLHEIQSQLNAIQIDKLKVYVQKQADKPKAVDPTRVRAMDLEAEQLAALEEFKEQS